MSILRKLLGKRKLLIYAPVDGAIVPLAQVPDPIFSEKMLGEGLAMLPTKGHIHAPINGTVILVAETKHAIGLRSKEGTELLIHIGLETVSLLQGVDVERVDAAFSKIDNAFIGILSGLIAAAMYNHFSHVKLPDFLVDKKV